MVASKIRDIISVTRKTARSLKQSLEELTEQLISNQRQKELEASLQRIPVRNTSGSSNQHPLLNRLGRRSYCTVPRRNYSTTSRRLSSTIPNTIRKPSVSAFTRNVIYQVQPFRVSTRAGSQSFSRAVRGGTPSSLYSHFTQHNARMFSTYGNRVAAEAVSNLTQGIRAALFKGSQLNFKYGLKDQVGSIKANKAYVDQDIKLARTDSESSNIVANGCFVDFNLSSKFNQTEILPEKFILGDDILDDLENAINEELSYASLVTSDIRKLKSLIGEPSSETIVKGRNRIIRCHFPNCECDKMERLLSEANITTGIVIPDSELTRLFSDKSSSTLSSSSDLSLSNSLSVISMTDSEGFSSTDDSVLSTWISEENNLGYSYPRQQILSSSDELDFFEPPVIVNEIYCSSSDFIFV